MDPMDVINSGMQELTVALVNHRRDTPEERLDFAVMTLKALGHIIDKRWCAGDIKTSNMLRGQGKFVLSDFDGAINIAEVIRSMNPQFWFANGWEKTKAKKTPELSAYCQIKYIPDVTKGYAHIRYTQAITDYFWRCEAQNYEYACNALDMRAGALSIYRLLTNKRPPIENKTDNKQYYDDLEQNLTGKVHASAIKLLRRMSEPPEKEIDCTKPFKPPVSREELNVLIAILEQQKAGALP